jgi:2-aminobenzoate-CoA ligase
MAAYTAHLDGFARASMPAESDWPRFNRAGAFAYPERLNAATALLDRSARMFAERPALLAPGTTWSYRRLLAETNRIAHVLAEDLELVPGNRVLLRGPNSPTLIACCLAVWKAGGIAVPTMPLLRAGELKVIADKTLARLALVDARYGEDMDACQARTASLERVVRFDGTGGEGADLEALGASKPTDFDAVATAAEDVAAILFTSGTTGEPKGAMHSHANVMAITESFPKAVLRPTPADVFAGTPPLAFAYGFGGLMAIPLRHGAAAVLLDAPGPDALLEGLLRFRATVCMTAPTAYRAMLRRLAGTPASERHFAGLRLCASAGEVLTPATIDAWREATGLGLVDGIGTTEMLNHFISAPPEDVRPGATGRALPGYEAMVVDDAMRPVPAGEIGRLAVRGPTGCRYLADPRQRDYVVDGWNLTGDAFRRDEDGYFWYAARTDDMIVSAGYNIAGPEVEAALLQHPAVAECAVVAAPDAFRGQIAQAFVVLGSGHAPSAALAAELQDFVKARIAPYKYPRAVAFLDALPLTATGKVQRYRLRELAAQSNGCSSTNRR